MGKKARLAVPPDRFAEAHCKVDILAKGTASRNMEGELQPGGGSDEPGEAGHQPFFGEGRRYRDPEFPGDGGSLQTGYGVAELVKGGGRRLKEEFPGSREFQPVSEAPEQREAKLFLEMDDLLRNRTVSDTQFSRGVTHMEVPRGGLERAQGIEGGKLSFLQGLRRSGPGAILTGKAVTVQPSGTRLPPGVILAGHLDGITAL